MRGRRNCSRSVERATQANPPSRAYAGTSVKMACPTHLAGKRSSERESSCAGLRRLTARWLSSCLLHSPMVDPHSLDFKILWHSSITAAASHCIMGRSCLPLCDASRARQLRRGTSSYIKMAWIHRMGWRRTTHASVLCSIGPSPSSACTHWRMKRYGAPFA